MKPDLDLDYVKARLDYDPETGIFVWKSGDHTPAKMNKLAGRQAGSFKSHGYIRIVIDKREIYAHRLAWFMTFGRWPVKGIDHINGNSTDNRLCNLREADQSQNMHNSFNRRNRTGYKNVYFCKDIGKWRAAMQVRRKQVFIGYFQTAEEAFKAYQDKAHSLVGEFVRVS